MLILSKYELLHLGTFVQLFITNMRFQSFRASISVFMLLSSFIINLPYSEVARRTGENCKFCESRAGACGEQLSSVIALAVQG